MITRLDKNGKPYECKTGRRRGEITEKVLAVARRGRPFTLHDLDLPSDVAVNRLWMMRKAGILRIVRPAIPWHRPTTYQLADDKLSGGKKET